MSPTILVAAAAALAILLIAAGIATSGRGSAVTERLERYASGRQEAPKPESTGQGPISDLIAQSSTVAALNRVVEQRDFGANISRELAQADLKLKVSEYLAIWVGTTVGVPILFVGLSVVLPNAGHRMVHPCRHPDRDVLRRPGHWRAARCR